ncbi:MAG: acetylornithine deacetylase, partial [Thalassobaculaceae bacterium]|nr:acetylornithine deacetylase [Thalassobaculaceae bacterium]
MALIERAGRDPMDHTLSILEAMIGFDTVSAHPNRLFQEWLQEQLQPLAPNLRLTWNDAGSKCNVFATIGPEEDGGIVLSGHSDVVPVAGQDWASDPFTLTLRDGRAYGRGTADMKGFLACCVATLQRIDMHRLSEPVHLAVSYDEELACLGAPRMIADLVAAGIRPRLCVVGEPTTMKLATAHKGAHVFRTVFHGRASHSSRPDHGANAIVAAAEFIAFIKRHFGALSAVRTGAAGLRPPVTTFNVGLIEGGVALNTVPETCTVVWEFRPIPEADVEAIVEAVQTHVETELKPSFQREWAGADIHTDRLADVPALDPAGNCQARDELSRRCGLHGNDAVAFGTEAGQFQQAGIPTVVCGPGSIDQAHKANEYVEIDQLSACLSALQSLIGS